VVCHLFDQQYVLGSIPGEPVHPNGGGVLRNLYAKYIDLALVSIEAAAVAWSPVAAQDYSNYWEQDAWYSTAFGAGGFAAPLRIRIAT
jgi:hypothetical protein